MINRDYNGCSREGFEAGTTKQKRKWCGDGYLLGEGEHVRAGAVLWGRNEPGKFEE